LGKASWVDATKKDMDVGEVTPQSEGECGKVENFKVL